MKEARYDCFLRGLLTTHTCCFVGLPGWGGSQLAGNCSFLACSELRSRELPDAMLDEIETTPEGEDNHAFRSDYGESLAKAYAGTETYPNVHSQRRVAVAFVKGPIAVELLGRCFQLSSFIPTGLAV